eukprot:TRINITY_DN10514_c0_g1_i1.p1 TRINITY_DN10514_c0_g1~~TRINITY_DN10514_c0_g1_i1.p1  ORF type:complete len:139 (+),score=38.16 TRINITY_DN10514_c0_g1_i1:49-465(+)
MSDQLSQDQIQEYKDVFNYFDKGKKGSLESEDFKLMMRALGEEDFSLAGGGSVDFNRFLANRQEKWAKQQSGDIVKHAFGILDRNGDGTVYVEDLKYLLTSQGEPLTQQEVNTMISEAGGGQYIDYRALVDLWQKKKN